MSYSMSIIDIAKLMHPPKGAELARAPGAKQTRQETGYSCLKSGIDFALTSYATRWRGRHMRQVNRRQCGRLPLPGWRQ